MIKERLFILIVVLIPVLLLAGFLKPEEKNPILSSIPDYNRFWTRKVNSGFKFNGLIIGDSRTYRGVSPEALASKIEGIKFFNFAFSAGGLNEEIFDAAEKRIEQNREKKILLIGVTPWTLTPNSTGNNQLRTELARTHGEKLDRMYFSYYTRFFNPVKPSRYLTRNVKIPKELYHEDFMDNGWVASTLIPENQKKAHKSSKESFNKNLVSAELLQQLLARIRKWDESGISVFVFRPPTTIELREMEDKLSHFDEQLLIDGVNKSGGTYIKAELRKYHSYDGSHLSIESAIAFSEFLAEQINRTGF